VNLQHVTIAHLMVSTDHATRTSIHTANKSCLKVGVNAPRQRFGVETEWNHQGIGENTSIPVDPMGFVLNRIHHNVMELVEKDFIQQLRQARTVSRLKSLIHVIQRFSLGVVQRSILPQFKG
jgi:hypothetical protein